MIRCKVKSCCFVIDLRRGTLAVAVFSLLGNISLLSYTSWCTNQTRMGLQRHKEVPHPHSKAFEYDIRLHTASLSTLALLLLVSVVAVLLDFLLLFGAFCHRREFLKCWLWGRAIISGVNFFDISHVSMIYFTEDNILAGSLIMVANLLGVVVTVYFWIVVHSYDLELRQKMNFPASRQKGPDVEACPKWYTGVMTRCKVKSCCFVIGLRCGTLAVAVFSLLKNIGVLSYTSWITNEISGIYAFNISALKALLSMQALLLLMSIVAILMDLLLFFGALRHRRKFLKCWLWGCAITSGVNFFYIWNVSMTYFARVNVLAGSLILVANLLDAVVTVYFWIAVHSYDLELRQKINILASRQKFPDVEALPMVLKYSQDQEDL